jgi:enoyl-CoA hydratase/carnithine racemase
MTDLAGSPDRTDDANSTGGAEPPVRLDIDGPVTFLTMQSRPHNFLGLELVDGLLSGLRTAHAQGARAVVIRSGLRNFCAGADVALFESAQRGVAPDLDIVEVLQAFDRLPIPIVAAVKGVCIGGGLEIALASDLVIAAESSKIGSIEATIGMNPLMGAMQRVTQRAGAARAKEMALLGRRYDARALERWNVINRVVPDEQLDDAVATLAQELAHGPTVAHAATKAIISVAANEGVAAADAAMGGLQAKMWASRDLKAGLESLELNGPGAARFEGN